MSLNISAKDFVQWIRYTSGLVIYGFITYYLTKINLGLAPWEILSKGISLHCPLTFGQVIIVVSVVILIIDILMKETIGVGMLLDAALVGVFVDVFTWLDPLPYVDALWIKIAVYLVGIVIMAFAQYLCMSSGQGLGPRDALLVGMGKRMRHVPIGAVQMGTLITVFIIGWLLGGPVGPGTVLTMLGMGPMLQVWCRVFSFEPRDVKHKSFLDYIRKNDDAA